MALRLHQTQVSCGRCGWYLWSVFKIVTEINGDKVSQHEVPEPSVCPNCDPNRWTMECIKNATKFEPLQRPEKEMGKGRKKGLGNIVESGG